PHNAALIIAVQVLHGICYAFFFSTAYILEEQFFPMDARASAQVPFNVVILGIGSLVANPVCRYLMENGFTHHKVTDFHSLFLVPCTTALGAAVLLVLLFHPPKKAEKAVPAAEAA